jgi:hypothetical protein
MRSSFSKLLQGPRSSASKRAASRAVATVSAPSTSFDTAAAPLDVGWHESSYELMRGVEVIEFDASEAPLIMAALEDV